MTGAEFKQARLRRGWTQMKAAAAVGVSQPYLSLLEKGDRPLTAKLHAKARRVFHLGPEGLPLPEYTDLANPVHADRFAAELGGLNYPGFAYLRTRARWNPSELLVRALAQENLDPRLLEGLPWVVLHYELNWDWMLPRVKMADVQNRLGFLVSLCRKLARATADLASEHVLQQVEQRLQRAKLQPSGTLCHQAMTNAERLWLREHSTPEAREWNLLCDWDVHHVVHY